VPKRLTKQEAYDKIILAHGDEYTYPDFNYVNSKTPFNIVCKKHGLFKQTLNSHVDHGQGCPACYGPPVITTEIFIKRAKEIHGSKYSYDLVKYIGAITDVPITCNVENHGIFYQSPNEHISSKAGCPKCAGHEKITLNAFFEKVDKIHNGKYTYPIKYFENIHDPLEIICPIHKSFMMRARNHYKGNGCPKCAIDATKLPLSDFIKRSRAIHGTKYIYLLVPEYYDGLKPKVPIICERHDIFWQRPKSHLEGKGCRACVRAKGVSDAEIAWLDSLGVPEVYRQHTMFIDGYKLIPDAFDPTTNTIYEYYGDYYHGNLNVYPPDKVNARNHKTMQHYATTSR
jgi:hypothetical protein